MDTAQAGWGFIISIFLCFFLIEVTSSEAGLLWSLFVFVPLIPGFVFFHIFVEQFSKDREQNKRDREQRKMAQEIANKRQEEMEKNQRNAKRRAAYNMRKSKKPKSQSQIDRERKRKEQDEKKKQRKIESDKKRMEKEKREKTIKITAFNNKTFQAGYTNPTISKKEATWIESGGKCVSCRNRRRGELGFWWRIYPSLELVLLCNKCAEDENLIEKSTEIIEKRSRTISQKVRDAVWRRDEGKCVQCGSNENLEFDHIIPFSKGGSNTKRNIQLLCESCNRKKSDNIG
jgi:hypothetical protein